MRRRAAGTGQGPDADERADSRFQDELRSAAISAGKLSPGYRIPERARANTPDAIRRALRADRQAGVFPRYPYGCEFTGIELTLMTALQALSSTAKPKLIARLARQLPRLAKARRAAALYLERMDLASPQGSRERLEAQLITLALLASGAIDSD